MKSIFSQRPFQDIYVIGFFFLIISCDKEEGKPDNSIMFNGKKYAINHAKLSYNADADLRPQDPNIEATHYSYSMRFTDGDLDPTNDFYIQNGSYKLTFSIFTTMDGNSLDFKGGTFFPVHPQDFFGSKAPLDKSFFTFFILRVDDNGNGVFDQNETWYDGLEGKVVIKGADEAFTVTIKTTTNDPQISVEGRYKGIFEMKR